MDNLHFKFSCVWYCLEYIVLEHLRGLAEARRLDLHVCSTSSWTGLLDCIKGENSEDEVSWSVFCCLEEPPRLRQLL